MEPEKPETNIEQQTDVQNNKVMALLAYFIFFIPLLTAKDSPFAMYHANQGLLLLLLLFGVNIVGTIIPLIGWMIVLPLGNLLVFVLFILGIINAANGHKKPLPLIGNYTLIK